MRQQSRNLSRLRAEDDEQDPAGEERFLRRSQNRSRARLLPALQKSPGFQNGFESNAVIQQ
jgi:hypothetical protein